MDNKEDVIQKSLIAFLNRHSVNIASSDIDDVLLTYIVGMLEDLGNQPSAGDTDFADFDVDAFVEVIEAYLAGFSSIKTEAVCDWMFQLMSDLNGINGKGEEVSLDERSTRLSEMIKSTANCTNSALTNVNGVNANVHANGTGVYGGTVNLGGTTTSDTGGKKRRFSRISESSTGCHSQTDSDDEYGVDLLVEMFPGACRLDVGHVLNTCRGDVEAAAQLLLHRHEQATEQNKGQSFLIQNRKKVNEEDVKSGILEKYAYIDVDEEKKSFRPPPPKYEAKKMIRYLDNKVVSTKGERFTEIKTTEEEQLQRVKTSKPRHH